MRKLGVQTPGPSFHHFQGPVIYAGSMERVLAYSRTFECLLMHCFHFSMCLCFDTKIQQDE